MCRAKDVEMDKFVDVELQQQFDEDYLAKRLDAKKKFFKFKRRTDVDIICKQKQAQKDDLAYAMKIHPIIGEKPTIDE